MDISDITLALMEGHIKIDGGVGDYTQFSITSNIEKERIDVAMFGRHDVDVFCNYLTQICRVHNVEDFLTEFHNSPLGRKRKKIYTYLRGTFLRQGLRTHNWKRKQYRICRVEDSTVEPPVEYGVLQFGPENVKPTDWMGYVILKDINLLIDSTISAGSDAIIIKANDASSAPIDENHRKLILILDPHSCHEGYSARRERIRAERDIAGNDNSDDDDSIGESAEEDYLEEVEEVTGGVPQRVHPSLHEISTFLMAIHKRAAKSNAEVCVSFYKSY